MGVKMKLKMTAEAMSRDCGTKLYFLEDIDFKHKQSKKTKPSIKVIIGRALRVKS